MTKVRRRDRGICGSRRSVRRRPQPGARRFKETREASRWPIRRLLALSAAALLLAGQAPGAFAANAKDYCTRNSGASAVDLSTRVNQNFLDAMKGVGVETIIRYYDHEDETIRGKTLRRAERDLIIKNGFQIAVVFQHHNDRFTSFVPERGRADAMRSLFLAKENSQPKGSAIYFGVDGPWGSPSELSNIKSYFKEANSVIAGSGYRVGVYGSGLVCKELLKEGLAELCWLANARGWPGYEEFHKTRKWRLAQFLPQTCARTSVDFSVTNGSDPDYGQFGASVIARQQSPVEPVREPPGGDRNRSTPATVGDVAPATPVGPSPNPSAAPRRSLAEKLTIDEFRAFIKKAVGDQERDLGTIAKIYADDKQASWTSGHKLLYANGIVSFAGSYISGRDVATILNDMLKAECQGIVPNNSRKEAASNLAVFDVSGICQKKPGTPTYMSLIAVADDIHLQVFGVFGEAKQTKTLRAIGDRIFGRLLEDYR